MRRLFLLLAATLVCCSAWSFQRETIAVPSKAMNKNVMVRVILPDNYYQMHNLSVVYLLHGHSGKYEEWDAWGKASDWVDRYGIMLVLPDGGYDSWYFDSPVDPTYKYETFVTKELIEYVDSHYKTNPTRTARAISGLSMGGHGALYLAFRNQDIYGAAGSTSGGVDIRPFPKNWGISKRLGTIEEHPENWEEHTVINLVERLEPGKLSLIIDCGYDDFFFKVNCDLHDKLLKAGIKHDFYVREGVHNWDYWRNSIQYQLLYFSNYFKAQQNK